jgi:hypothetical protein
MQGIKLSQSLADSVSKDYLDGCKLQEIATKYGISLATINNIRISRELERRRVNLSETIIQTVKELFDSNNSIKEIAAITQFNSKTVSKALKTAGVSSAEIKLAWTKKQTIVKVNPFADLSSPVVQYYLGLLATDGCIHSKSGSVSLGLKDLELIQAFSKFVGFPRINHYRDARFENCFMYSVKFVNWEAVAQLESLGLTSKKTHTLAVSFALSYPFLRGVIDGDGCVRLVKNTLLVSIATASHTFKEQLVNFLTSEGFNVAVTAASNIFNIRVSCK